MFTIKYHNLGKYTRDFFVAFSPSAFFFQSFAAKLSRLSDEYRETVNGGMKIAVEEAEEESSLFRTEIR